jgi:lactate dehydrogenase-like 2-hydroxyacid dehydrogenase
LLSGPVEPSGFAPELLNYLKDAVGLITLLTDRVDEVLLEKAPHLLVVSNMAVGVDNIDVNGCTRRGIPVGNTPDVLTEATADLTVAILLAAARRLTEAALDAREGHWKTWSPTGWLGADLCGATLGIIGMGKIGRAVAKRGQGFGLQIIYTDLFPYPEIESKLGAIYLPMDELIHESDFVSLLCPLASKTYRLVDERFLRKMKPSAILVNAARGQIIDTDALVRALSEKWIAAAAMDVTDPEPLPPDHSLYKLSNCFILPHIGSATYGTRRQMAQMACENLLAGLEGRMLPFCVNPYVYNK